MKLKNCIECGKLYLENHSGLCPSCYVQEELDEQKVGEYLRENGKSSIEQINKVTGVKEKTILRMMKSGRLITEGLIAYPCEICRSPIYEGRLCLICSGNLVKQVKDVWDKGHGNSHNRAGIRMYTKDREES